MTFTRKIIILFSAICAISLVASLSCFASAKTKIHFSRLEPLCAFSLTTSGTNVSCSSGTDGTVTVVATGGSGSYSYAWSGTTQTTATATALTAGTYTVTVTDNSGGCTATATVAITQPLPISVPTTKTDVSCSGMTDGTGTANASGGNGSYTYSWTDGQTTQTAVGLAVGSYIVKVTDIKGCTKTALVTIGTKPAITVAITATNVSCSGGSNGTLTATPTNGTAPFNYTWTGGSATATATGLTHGSYTVTVTDSKGCTATSVASVTEPIVLSVTTSQTNVSCNGGNNGSITATPAGGTSAYSYAWSGTAQTTATANSLTAASYTVTVTDANGCTATTAATVTEPTALTLTATSTQALCFGGSTGTVTANPGGGAGAYVYTWSTTPVQNTATATALAAGSYTVTIKDANGCTKTASATVGQPTALTASTTVTNVLCFGGSTGTSTVTGVGGTTIYTYAWSTTPVQTTATATGLANGSYTVTVKDANGCTTTAASTITQPTALTSTSSVTNLSCNSKGDGKATASPAGGTATYTYAWSSTPLQTSATATNLPAGGYTVTITDANGCTITNAVNITEPPPVITSQSGKSVSCAGGNDGKAWVTPNGSKAPYVYAWNPSLSINDTIFTLSAGNYTVTVTDAAGCKQSTVITITQPPVLTGTVVGVNSGCSGVSDGSATITPAGGSGAYTYSWNTIPSQNTATATNLGPGTFTIKLSDANGCEFYANVTISSSAPLLILAPTITKETCQLGNGKASISVVGGTAPLTYTWDPTGQTTSTAVNLSAGTYTVTATDSKGCSATKTAVVTNQFTPPSGFASTNNNVSCFGASNGKASVLASSGTAPYVYNWGPSGGTAMTATGLSPNTYTVTVTDVNGCTVTSTTIITEPAAMNLNPASTNTTCGASVGSAGVSPSGGTAPYTYLWSNTATASTVNSLGAGSYTVTVTDAGACSLTKTFSVVVTNPLSITSSSTNITCNGAANGTGTITASGGSGSFNYTWAPSGGSAATATGLGPGTYTVTVSDAGAAACSGTTTVVITQPAALIAPLIVTNISCAGSNSGQESVTPSGGAGSYTYLWSNGGVTNAITGLAAGPYTVTVTDASGCTVTASGTVTSGAPLTAITSGTNINCFGQNTGQAVVTAGGGSGTYSYNWLPGGSVSATATNLTANTYTVTVTDGGGCTKTATISITQPPAFTISTSKTDASCGSTNGNATATPAGGVPAYTYAWTGGGNAGTISNLAAGGYTVTVSDANGCTQTSAVTINIANPLSATSIKTNITCNGAADGSGTITATGASGSYNYNWSPGGYNSATVSNLGPAVYTVTVSDAGSAACSTTLTISVTQPPVLNANITGTDITCNGSANGQASSSPTGGTAPYTYQWNTSSTSSSITGLSPSTYSVTVTDANGCTNTASVPIVQGAALAVSISSQTNVSCFGLANGSATVNAAGGTGTLTYLWSPSGGTAANASGLPANTYTVSINDANGCASTIAVTITQPADIILTPATTTATCGVSDGTATISPAGGTPGFTYNWSSGGNTAHETGLAPGNYVVTVSDANGCTKTQSATIVVGNPISLISSKADLSCSGSADGMAGVSSTGGTGTYNYLWNPGGSTTSSINGLSAGSYTVTVTDAVNSGCTSSIVVTVNQPNPLTATVASTDITCFGMSNGTVNATINGGTPAYSYTWSPTAGAGSGLTGLGAGTYSVTISDNNGCTATSTGTVNEPPPLTLTTNFKNVSCIGAMNGGIGAHVGGGVPAYTYNWAPTGGPTDSIGGLGPGTYTLTVTDANGCTITTTETLTEPPAFHITTGKQDPSCYNNDGSAYVTVTGGSGSFSYVWTPGGATSATITGLGPGTYQVRVVDLSTGCDTIGTETLVYPVVSLVLDSTNVTCANFGNAKAWAIPSGATAPYTYLWSSGGVTTDTITGLSPGTYTVTVHDHGGCSASAKISVSQPTSLSLTKTSADVSCFGGNNGTATVNPAGGITPYTYSWSNGQTSQTINNLISGGYTVAIADSNNCSVIDSVRITQPPKLIVHADSVIISCNGANDGQVMVTATSGGTGSYTYAWSAGGATGLTVTGLSPAVYTVTVTDANACTSTDDVTVTEPTVLTLAMNIVNTSCGQSTGKASVTANGANGTYTYLWSPGGSVNDTIFNLAKGSYTVTVTDQKGCSKIDSVQITEPNAIAITTSGTNITCNGANDGSASVTANGGSGTFIYSWNPGAYSTASINNLSPGTYTVTVKDQVNTACTLIDSVVVTQPTKLTSTVTSTNVTCFNAGDGTANVTANGGITGYTYSWSTTSTNSSVTGLVPNTYTVKVTDANGCTSTSTASITQPAILAATTSGINITCNGYNNGQVSVIANGGSVPYSYSWSPGGILNDTIYNTAPGTYTVTVSDNNNCSTSSTVTITQPAGMTLTMAHTNTACGNNIGTANVSVVGGISPYTYLWSNGNTNSNVTGLFKGLYHVTVTDNKGCTKSDSVKVTEPNGIVISFTATNITCNGANNGKVTVTATGGTGSFVYSWIPGGNTNTTLTGLSPGTYPIQVSDATNLICSTTDSITITQPAVLSVAMSQTSEKCFGDSNAVASALVTGGTTPYTYLWTPTGSTTSSITSLKQGSYTISVKDKNGCTTTNSIAITQPTTITTSTSGKQATCGNLDGEAYVSANGGTGAFTYSWTPVYTANDTLLGLLPGEYYVYVNDVNGCIKKDSVAVTLTNGIIPTLTSVPITCYGRSDGEATVSANGGSGNFIYSWSPGGNTTPNIVNLAPGMYTVTITDVNINGCVKVDSIFVQQPLQLDVNVAVTKASCSGNNNFIVTANPIGGTPGYTYNWSFGGTNQTESNQIPGTYIIEVTDSKGCDTAKIFNINSASSPFILPPLKVNPKCNLANGSIVVSIFGGVTPYTYSWSPNVSVNDTAKNLASGTYTLTVTDAFNCTDSRTVTLINTALPPNITASVTPATCFGASTGGATAVANAGSLPYSYSWLPSGGTNASATNIPAGIYTITVIDGQACTATAAVTVTQPPDISISIIPSDALCFGNANGTASATVGGGTPAYSYSWSSGGNALLESNLAAGKYYLSVTDANACIKSDSVVISQPTILSSTISVVNNVSCNAGSNGSIKVTATGGTLNYSYSWTPAGGIDSVATALTQGTFSVTITDNHGCTVSNSATLTEPGVFTANVIQKNISCFGGNDGGARAIISGATGPYIYSWQGISNFTDTISNVSAGSYTIHVIDSLGCSFAQVIAITQPAKVTASIAKTDLTCNGSNNGIAVASVTGGTAGYTYTWKSIGVNGATASNLAAGSYTVNVNDANGCADSSFVTLTQPTILSFTTSHTDLNCNNDSTGKASLTASGGTPGYTYSWLPGNYTTATMDSLVAGTYTITVTDINGCPKIDSVTITQPTPLAANATQVDVTCNGKNTGSITLNASGATPGYSYTWSSGQNTSSINSLTAGTYLYTITDSKGCTLNAFATISQGQVITLAAAGVPTKCYNSCDGQAVVIPSNGVTPYTFAWSNGGTNPSISNLCTANYTVSVTDANGCNLSTIVSVTQPTQLVLTTSSTTAHCNHDDGSATAVLSGGTSPYSYSWKSTSKTNALADSLTAGIYTIITTDNNGCIDSANVTVANVAGPSASISSFTNTTCAGNCVGTATSQVSGGSGPYTYSWNSVPAQTNATAVSLCAGNYSVAISDKFGCVDTGKVTIAAPTITVLITASDTNICIGQTSHIIATASGGTPAYNFTWDNGAYIGQNYDVNPTTAATYTVIATDANGCPSNPVEINVHVKPPLQIMAHASPPAACPGTPTTVTVAAAGGDGNYTYSWQPGSYVGSSITIAPSATTTYTIIVNDGCSTPVDTAIVTVTVYPDPVVQFTARDTSGCLNTCTDFVDKSTVANPSTIVSWIWNFGDGKTSTSENPTHCYDMVGKYNISLTVKTDKGCSQFLTKPDYVNIDGLPVAEFIPNPDSVSILAPIVNFIDKSQQAVNWRWDFGDGSAPDSSNAIRNPVHTYKDTGTYCIWQVVTNIDGCVDSIKHCLRVYPEFTFYIPNAFSPNGDGINDTFNGVGTYIKEYKMLIFDRWGNLIFETDDLHKNWNGHANYGDSEAQQDVYVWKVELTDVFDRDHKYMGHVTLVK